MTYVDVAVIGGGIAGSLVAAMLGRAGVPTMIVDIHQIYPEEFRCEKIHDDQAELLYKTGLADAVLPTTTPIWESWVCRRGHILAKLKRRGKPHEYGVAYQDFVNAVRRQIPDTVPFICAKATSVTNSIDTQQIALSNGDTWTARLIVLATGLNNVLH